MLEAERSAPEASITTFGEAVWWTITTISTVGYGDRYPVTVEGRLVAGDAHGRRDRAARRGHRVIAAWFVENVRRRASR